MAHRQAKSNTTKNRRRTPIPKDQGKRPQGITKQQAVRKSPRLQVIQQSHRQSLSKSNHIQKAPSSPPTSNNAESKEVCPFSAPLTKSQRVFHELFTSSRKLKPEPEEEAGHSSPQTQDQIPSEKLRSSSSSCSAKLGSEEQKKKRKQKGKKSDINDNIAHPIKYWTLHKRWPKDYFEQSSQLKEDLEQDSWLEERMEYSIPVVQYVEINGWRLPCPIRRDQSSLRRKRSDASLNSDSSNQINRERNIIAYKTARYETLLECKRSYMRESDFGITEESSDLCQRLLRSDQAVPKDSLFRDDLFAITCNNLRGRNEARVVQDIARLIVPSAETLATYGATHLDHLIEGVSECWLASIPVEGPRPQPDYSVGFKRSAFTEEQLRKLSPLIGTVYDTSYLVATYRMYFPFFTCEVKCGAAALDVADRQNAHSMTIAVRGIVELYKTVKREKELDREILAISISHDHNSVRIYGHYPVIEGDKTTCYRHSIRAFYFTDGGDKWTAYKFTKNVYDKWMPLQHERICSAIDDLPNDISFDLSQSASFSQPTPQRSQQSNAETITDEDDSQLRSLASQEDTPTTSFTQATEPVFKKPRKPRADGQRH